MSPKLFAIVCTADIGAPVQSSPVIIVATVLKQYRDSMLFLMSRIGLVESQTVAQVFYL